MSTTDKYLKKGTKFAVVGASNSQDKYGYKVYKRLKDLGFTVYPINPREELIQGDYAYENLYQLPEKVDVLSFVVPPNVSLKVSQTAYEIGYKVYWYQPGSFNSDVINFHKDKPDTHSITTQCLLIETNEFQK